MEIHHNYALCPTACLLQVHEVLVADAQIIQRLVIQYLDILSVAESRSSAVQATLTDHLQLITAENGEAPLCRTLIAPSPCSICSLDNARNPRAQNQNLRVSRNGRRRGEQDREED